ncbi:uncharacterized protein LOC115885194 [Sitophilus oryzae]|uniref:Uncharacterized protein LOC115885194 n=1 Tax=Sitophilus oryzae TaxID=7048 RepID=A0A6J2Y9K2_SITOR|nr:uncharacterized protein LOC115885194 [Sitophilus oryzae]
MKMFSKSISVVIVVAAVLLMLATPEVEARRKILRGRKTVTRTYLRPMAIPAWAIIVLTALGELIIGAVIYVILKKTILDTPVQGSYSVAPTNEV